MIDYKIAFIKRDGDDKNPGPVRRVYVYYYQGDINPKTGEYERTALIAQETLAPNKSMTDEELLDSLNARCQAKYPKEVYLIEQDTVGQASVVDPSYPVINEGKDQKVADVLTKGG